MIALGQVALSEFIGHLQRHDWERTLSKSLDWRQICPLYFACIVDIESQYVAPCSSIRVAFRRNLMKREHSEDKSRKARDPLSKARTIRLEELLLGQREILIAHCQEVYRLRLTRNGKLLLTK